MSSTPRLFPQRRITPAAYQTLRRPRPRFAERGFLPSRGRRSWGSLGASVVAHLLVVAVALLLSRRVAPETEVDEREAMRPQAVPIYIPLPPPRPPERPPEPRRAEARRPPPEPRVAVPPPRKRQPRPEPEPNAPPEATRSSGTEEPDAAAGAVAGAERAQPPAAVTPAPRAPAAPAEVAAAPTLESEARRIFGRMHAGPPAGAGPRDVRPLQVDLPDRPDKCVPRPSAPAESAGPVQYGEAVGRIFRGDTGTPLAGAHLVMLGTTYTAFTDENGEYHFRFDLSLVDNCRTQYVRVSAPGYQSRLLVLLVGPHVRSEDVTLRRR